MHTDLQGQCASVPHDEGGRVVSTSGLPLPCKAVDLPAGIS